MPKSFPDLLIPRDMDPRLYGVFRTINAQLRELTQGLKAAGEGSVPSGGSADLGSALTQLGSPRAVGSVAEGAAQLQSPGIFAVSGNLSFTDTADASKRVRFTAASLTTGVTRSVAFPDASGTVVLTTSTDPLTQYLLLAGRTGGQILGSGAHTGGSTTDLVLEGRLLLAPTGINFTANRILDIRPLAVNNSALCNIQPDVTALSGTASGTLTALQVVLSGTPGYTAGAFTARGFFFTASLGVPAGTTLTEMVGALVQASVGSAFGTLGKVEALQPRAQGPSLNSGGTTLSELGACDAAAANRTAPCTLLYGYRIGKTLAGFTYAAAITDAVALEVDAAFAASANVATWHGLRIPAIAGPAQMWGLDIGDIWGRHMGPLALGWTPATNAAVTAKLHLGAGTAAAGTAPLKLTSGTKLTAAEAGAVENDGTDFFVTDDAGDRNRLAPRLLSRTTGIDGTATGTTTIYVVPTGRTLVVTQVVVRTTAFNSGSCNLQVDGVAATDICGSQLFAPSAAGRYMLPGIKNPAVAEAAGTGIALNITATTMTATTTLAVDLIGYLY